MDNQEEGSGDEAGNTNEKEDGEGQREASEDEGYAVQREEIEELLNRDELLSHDEGALTKKPEGAGRDEILAEGAKYLEGAADKVFQQLGGQGGPGHAN